MRVWDPSAAAATVAAAFSTVPGVSSIHISRHTASFVGPIQSQYLPPKRRRRHQIRLFSSTSSSSDPSTDIEDATPDSFATSYHAPVMWRECIDALLDCQSPIDDSEDENRKPLLLVDGTLGGGGHSAAILERLHPGDVLLGCDVDPDALATASERLNSYTADDTSLPLFVPVQSNFGDLHNVLPTVLHPTTQEPLLHEDNKVDGILLDLGVSSHQIDTAERGFAFMKDGPLDMRMNVNSSSLSAADICNEYSENELSRLMKHYGDEPRARRISEAIVQHRPLTTTQDLYNAVASVTPQWNKQSRRKGLTATLARVFQSLRIVVNQEDEVLKRVLTEACPALIRPGGRLVVLSYHSMEDRFTKRVMRDGSVGVVRQRDEDRDMYGNYIGAPKPWRMIGKRQRATEEEVEVNPRARSATLRVAERMDT